MSAAPAPFGPPPYLPEFEHAAHHAALARSERASAQAARRGVSERQAREHEAWARVHETIVRRVAATAVEHAIDDARAFAA